MILQSWETHGSLFIACSVGIVYTIDPAYAAEVREYLGEYIIVLFTFLFVLIILMIVAVDYREKDGYTIEHVDVYGIVDDTEKVVVHSVCCSHLRIDDLRQTPTRLS